MDGFDSRAPQGNRTLSEFRDEIRRGVVEFAAVPAWVVGGFLLLAAGTYTLDHLQVGWLTPVRAFMQQYVFADAQATSDLLGTVASSLITVTSITFSLLLLAVQQSAASMTSEVLDQYLRRRLNQVFFGFYVGLALYALIVLSTVDPPYNPVYGASIALLLVAVALALLPILLYSTIDQMRPAMIIEAIHDHTLAARQRQLSLLRRTRRAPASDGSVRLPVEAAVNGFVVGVDVDAIEAAIREASSQAEVALQVAVGSYVAFRDTIAEVRAGRADHAAVLAGVVVRAVRLGRQRDLDRDPAYGIQQLETIAWTSISSSKQNPAPGMLTVYALRDLLARWCADGNPGDPPSDEQPGSIVYTDDIFVQLFDAFESLVVISTESMQHQIFAEVVRTFATLFQRLPPDLQARVEDLVGRALSGLGDHMPTADLDAALAALAHTLATADRTSTAVAVQAARAELNRSVGRLNSRATRVPTEG
jgi:uncharacterized membrane protein